MRTKLVRLRREGRSLIWGRIRTNDGTPRVVELTVGRRIGWRGQVSLRHGGANVQCDITHNINCATDVMAVRIPRSCLNNPRWVEMKLVSAFLGRRQILFDPSHNDGTRFSIWTPRIRRG